MFGFSLITLLVATFGTLSALSALLVIGACVASGNASRHSELAFEVYMQQQEEERRKRKAANSSLAGHRTYSPAAPVSNAEVSEAEVQGGGHTESVTQPKYAPSEVLES